MRKGVWYGVGAYVLWGFLPIYWKWLHTVPALQVVSHRVVWSCVTLAVLIAATRQAGRFRAAALNRRVLAVYSLAGALIGVNWLLYIWAVMAGFIVETSLGYFINPLVSVLLGVVFLRERLRPAQWLAVALAAAGVLVLTVLYGSPPWIALGLAASFGIYGLVKKKAPLGSLFGLTLETGLLLLPALAYLIGVEAAGQGAFLHTDWVAGALLAGAGLVTTAPLLLFAAAAQRIPLSLVGVLQYIAPTMQFLIGVFLYREPFSPSQLIGFGLVWVALAVFGLEGWWAYRNRPAAAT